MKTKIDQIIDQVLIENNKHWLPEAHAQWNIDEGRVPITRQDIHDIIQKLPIKILDLNYIHAEITPEGIVIKPNKQDDLDKCMSILKTALDKEKNRGKQ